MLSTATEDSNIWRHKSTQRCTKEGDTLLNLEDRKLGISQYVLVCGFVLDKCLRQGVLTLKALYHICGLLYGGDGKVSEESSISELNGLCWRLLTLRPPGKDGFMKRWRTDSTAALLTAPGGDLGRFYMAASISRSKRGRDYGCDICILT